jgi:hypothetical protein
MVEERERAAAETAVTAARAARLAMAELRAARTEVEAAVAVAELEALRGNSISNSVLADGGTDDELKLAREAARELATQWAATPLGARWRQPRRARTRRRRSGRGRVWQSCPRRRRQPRQARTCRRLGRRR